MQNVILQPTGNSIARDNFNKTISSGVPLDLISSHLSFDKASELSKLINGKKTVATWGVKVGFKDGNKNKWLKIERGDLALFGRNKRIHFSGIVASKVHSPELAKELWGEDEDGNTWEYIYFLDETKKHSIPYEELNKVIGYSANYIIQGFVVLDQEKSRRVFENYDLTSEIHIPFNADQHGENIFIDEDLDRKAQVNTRREQAYLRNKLFNGRRIGECHFCKNEMSTEFLVAAHIKKRAECNKEERLDLNNIVIPLCKFGCDELFERGYILVKDCQVVSNPNKVATGYLKEEIEELEGTPVSVRDSQEEYFNEHYNFHTRL